MNARLFRLLASAALCALIVGCLLLPRTTAVAYAEEPLPLPVEVFDVKQGRVVHTVPLTNKLKKLIVNSLNDTPKPYEGVTMNPTSGVIVHVRFAQPTKLRAKRYPEPVNEAYLFLDLGKSPLALLFFSSGHPPRIYTLQAKPERLMKAVQQP